MIDNTTLLQLEREYFNWRRWARPDQVLPPGNWVTFLLIGGRGAGKTRSGAEAVRQWIREGFNNVNIIGATAADVRDVMVEGPSGILSICPKSERPEYLPSKNQLRWPNGARTLTFSSEEPDRLRGPQHEKLWCDEIMAWAQPQAALDMARFGLRAGLKPQMICTTTPKPSKLLRELRDDPTTIWRSVASYANRGNLNEAFFTQIISKYEGTRLGRQELNGEFLEDNPGALWHWENIEQNRLQRAPQNLARIVVAIDPAVTSSEGADETGIVVCGCDDQRPPHFYVLADLSTVASPDAWARRAVAAYRQYHVDRIIGETNNGGEMIEATLRHVDPNVGYAKVSATRGKALRAEPIAALYEQNRVHHCGSFAALETQLCEWTPDAGGSPDRLDALVWALTELSEKSAIPNIVKFWELSAARNEAKRFGRGEPPPRLPQCNGNPSTGEHEIVNGLCVYCKR
jgi:phage terminase large subunit-like protein